MTDFSGLSLEELQKLYDECQAEITRCRNRLDESERERREEQERVRQKYGDSFLGEIALGFPPCTGLEGLCNELIQESEKSMAEIEAEMERRKAENEQKR